MGTSLRNRCLYYFLFFIAGFVVETLRSQQLKFEQLDLASNVNVIYEDKLGFLWVATPDGLIRYNGYSKEIYRSNPKDSLSLSNNFVNDLVEDKNGILWIATIQGLNYYHPLTGKIRHVFRQNKNISIRNVNIHCLLADDSVLWIGSENGLYKMNLHSFRITKIRFPLLQEELQVTCLLKTDSTTLMVGTANYGVIKYDTFSKIYGHVFPSAIELQRIKKYTPKSFHLIKINALLHNKSKNELWIGTAGNLLRYDLHTGKYRYSLPPACQNYQDKTNITAIAKRKNEIFVASHFGLFIYYEEKDKWNVQQMNEQSKYALKSNELSCLYYSAANDIVWIGSTFGLFSYKPLKNIFLHYGQAGKDSVGVLYPSVMSFTQDHEGNIWVATLGGISVLHKTTKKLLKQYDSHANKNHRFILRVFKDNRNRIWVGSWGGGLNYYDPVKKQFTIPFDADINSANTITNNTIMDITQDSTGRIWIATYNGLSAYYPDSGCFKNYYTLEGLNANIVNDVYYDHNNRIIWVGTTNGINAISAETGKVLSHINPNLPQNSRTVFSIASHSRDKLWLGTSLGLFLYDFRKNKWEVFYQQDGLSNDLILGVIPENENVVWLTTFSGGISKFIYREGLPPIVKNYNEEDGLQGDAFNQGSYFVANDGEIYIGGENGFNAFYPENVTQNRHVPPVYITNIKVFEKEIPLDTTPFFKKGIEISYKDRFLTIDFVGIDFNFPGKIQYSWRMEGLEENWTQPSYRMSANYGNLPGGYYVFHVKAANNEGVWNEQGARIAIRVIPPFYQTKLFYVSVMILALLLIYLYTYWRTYNVQREKRILEQKVAERTKELDEKNKDILSSIQYAQRIQKAMLPSLSSFYQSFPRAFIFYRPKDIVSGDFYWFSDKGSVKYVAAVDCTGHGVPGALMSMIGMNILNQIVNEKNVENPAEILNHLNDEVVMALKQEENIRNIDTFDGMDIALVKIDYQRYRIEFAGAYRPLLLVDENHKLHTILPDKYPIGGARVSEERRFTAQKIAFLPGVNLYLFSDGYPDQFGGSEGKKFMLRRFKDLILEMQPLDMEAQGEKIEKVFDEWKGNLDQIDDVLVIGIKL